MFNNPFLMQLFQRQHGPRMGLGGLMRPPSDAPHPMFGGFQPMQAHPTMQPMQQGVAVGEQNPMGFNGLAGLMRRPAPRVLR